MNAVTALKTQAFQDVIEPPASEQPELLSPVYAEPTGIDEESRCRMIAEAAYYLAEARGFACGSELEDWLAAEAQVSHTLGATLAA
jgi:hypothetical protein